MKKIVYVLILLFIFTFTVSAANISPSKMTSVINSGDITEAFKKTNDNCSIDLRASGSSNIVISYNVSCTEKVDDVDETKYYNGTFELIYDSAKNQLATEVKVGKKEIGQDIFLVKIMKLIPYWTAEASDKYPQIKKKMGNKDILVKMSEIFYRCYLEETGVCYSEMPSYGDMIYTAKVNLDDTAANFALKVFKEDDEAASNSRMNKFLIMVAGGLILLILIFKSMTPGKEKY